VIDKDPSKIKYQPENGIYLSEFKGDANDKSLYELIPLLEHLARPEVRDVRTELKKYGNVDVAKKYLEELQAR